MQNRASVSVQETLQDEVLWHQEVKHLVNEELVIQEHGRRGQQVFRRYRLCMCTYVCVCACVSVCVCVRVMYIHIQLYVYVYIYLYMHIYEYI